MSDDIPLPSTQEQLMNDLLDTPTTVSSVPPMVPPAPIHKPKKQSNGGVLALVAALLLTLPVAVYYISQQNQQIADTRSRANPPPGPYGNVHTRNECLQFGDVVTEPGAECGCGGYRVECVIGGQHYFIKCETNPNANCGDDDTGDDTTVTPVCQNIKIYKNGTQVTPSSLVAGDVVVLAVKGNLTPDKAHFRINGGAWSETTTKNSSDEFTSSYTVPTGVSDFVIEGEVFTTGAWR